MINIKIHYINIKIPLYKKHNKMAQNFQFEETEISRIY